MVDDRSPTAKAMSIVSQITTIGVAMVLPTIAGHGLDKWLGTAPVLLLIGLALGFLTGGIQFVRMVRKLSEDEKPGTE